MRLFETAHAKVNLFLHVLGRRADGYHLLDSLVVFAAPCDALSATPADTLTLTVDGPYAAAVGPIDENLVLRAAARLAAATGTQRGARLALTKHLPVASGIGGGSADAAAVLRLLTRLWELDLGGQALANLAAGIGADVPVCLATRPARMGGIGERIGPAPRLPRFGLLLANPGIAVPTPAVFAARTGAFDAEAALPEGWDDAEAMAADLTRCGNGLEAAASGLCPEIATTIAVLRALPGALLARLSGSGATCFAIFATDEAAGHAAAALAANHPGWWIGTGTVPG